jgi:hypothetical protein
MSEWAARWALSRGFFYFDHRDPFGRQGRQAAHRTVTVSQTFLTSSHPLQGIRKGVDIRSLLVPRSSLLLLTCMFSRIIQLTIVRPSVASVIESAFGHQGRDLAGCSSLGFTGDLRT